MKNVPLRDWNSASYSNSGRAAKSSEPPQARQSADGISWTNTDNMGRDQLGIAKGGAPAIPEGVQPQKSSGDPGRIKENRD